MPTQETDTCIHVCINLSHFRKFKLLDEFEAVGIIFLRDLGHGEWTGFSTQDIPLKQFPIYCF